MPSNAGPAAVQLRVEGASWIDIAETCGLANPQAAVRAVHDELARHLDTPAETREMLRFIESERLNLLYETAAELVATGQPSDRIPAIRAAVAIIDRRVRLHGLDAPTEIHVYSPATAELEGWVAQMVAASMPAITEPDIIEAVLVAAPQDAT